MTEYRSGRESWGRTKNKLTNARNTLKPRVTRLWICSEAPSTTLSFVIYLGRTALRTTNAQT